VRKDVASIVISLNPLQNFHSTSTTLLPKSTVELPSQPTLRGPVSHTTCERVREESIRIDRVHVGYERAAVRPSMDQVLGTLAKAYGLKVEDLLTGRRGRDNEPRKLGMYLVKELCDLKLSEIAQRFGTSSYGTVDWACHAVAARMNADTSYCNRVTRIRRNCQPKT
jgi:hypothetical protein